jgi:phage recombination protein Bet
MSEQSAIVRQIDELPTANLARVDVQAIEAAKTAIFPKDGTEGEWHLALAFCQRTGLDPLRKQVYFMKVQGKLTIMVGIDGMLTQAGRSGLYLGATEPLYCGKDGVWTDVWLQEGPPAACKVGVFRKGAAQPTYATILYSEFCVPTNPNWKQRPAHMLAVRALAHALKRCFPSELQDVALAETGAEPEPVYGQATIREEPAPVAMPNARCVEAVQAGEKTSYAQEKGLPAPAARPLEGDVKAIVQANLKQLGVPDPKKSLPYLGACLGEIITKFSEIKPDEWQKLAGVTGQAVKDKGACFALWGKHNPNAGTSETPEERAFRLKAWSGYLSEEIATASGLAPAKWALLRDAITQEFEGEGQPLDAEFTPETPASDPFQDE